MINRIALGTVQFGLQYGIANRSSRVSQTAAAAILDMAWSAGMTTLDTAVAYGESEQRLGEIGVKQWQVVSKLPGLPQSCPNVEKWVRQTACNSLQRLGISKLYGLLLHRPQDLLGAAGAEVYAALAALKDDGLVEKIGISIYDPQELDSIYARFRLDLVQAPFSIVDRRIAMSGWLRRLHDDGTEAHVRSVFLQGLLLMKAEDRDPFFQRWQPLWTQWHRWLDARGITPVQACLGFALSCPEVDRVVVGVDSPGQLQAAIANFKGSVEVPQPPSELASDDLDLLIPSRWNIA